MVAQWNEYHSEFQGIVQGLNSYRNIMLGHLFMGCIALYPAFKLVCHAD